jgi:hypothetical protein
MIIGIEGGIGQGKTLVMTALLVQESAELGKPLYANYTLRNRPFERVDIAWLVEAQRSARQFDKGRGAAIGLDEVHVLLDSRNSQRSIQKLVSYFILQTGKEGINLYYTTQDFGQVEKRLRQRTDIAITVEKRGDIHKCLMVDKTSFNARGQHPATRFAVDGALVWDEYYTREVVRSA